MGGNRLSKGRKAFSSKLIEKKKMQPKINSLKKNLYSFLTIVFIRACKRNINDLENENNLEAYFPQRDYT